MIATYTVNKIIDGIPYFAEVKVDVYNDSNELRIIDNYSVKAGKGVLLKT